MSVTFSIVRLENINGRDVWCHADGDDDLFLNVANGNAAMILRELGIEFDYCGSVSAPEMLAMCVVWRAVTRNPRTRATVETGGPGTGQARMIECGVGEEYLPRVIGTLERIAEAARETGGEVGWA